MQNSGRILAELYDWQDSGRTLAGFSQDSGKTLVGVVGFWQNSGRILANLTKIVLTTDGLWRDLTCLTKWGPPKMASVRILSEIPELASAVRLSSQTHRGLNEAMGQLGRSAKDG